MQVKDVMTANVECANPGDTIAEVAAKMRELDIGALPVYGEEGRLVGMITDRDITVRATAGARDPSSTYVEDVMSPQVISCLEDQDVTEAAQLMKDHQVRRLVVLDHDQKLVGIVSLGDLAVDTGDEELAGEALERISEPAEPRYLGSIG